MMRRNPGIVAICFLFSSLLHAHADTAVLHGKKMEMIRAAVNFYSEDTTLSKTPVNCESTEVPGLKTCAKRMLNVDKIDKWNGVSVHDEAALGRLANTIMSDVTKERIYREKLSAYEPFKAQIQELSTIKAEIVPAKLQVPGADSTVSASPVSAPAPETPPQPLPARGAGDAARIVPAAPMPPDVPVWQDPLLWSGGAILIAILALIVALMARSRSARRQSGKSRRTPFAADERDARATQSGVAALERKVAGLEQELGTLNTMIADAERRMSDKLRRLEAEQGGSPSTRHQAVMAHEPFPVTRRWAKNVDGGGFELGALSPEPDSKMIYEITQTGPEAATYKVSDTREAQLFALSNPQNYLREGCVYMTQPAANSQIRTEVPGTLELRGRKWRIVSQAQIAFS